MSASLLSIGCAVPEAHDQRDVAVRLADAWKLDGRGRERWERIVRGAGVERRHAVMDIASTLSLSTAERMRRFECAAPPLAARAARSALETAGLDVAAVTDVVVVTCTGFASPGIGHSLVRSIGLRPTVRHAQVGFMGCFGGIIGLRMACGMASADPAAVVLVLCVELCSLHLRLDTDPQQLVAAALFSDGAAAAIVGGFDGAQSDRLALGRTRIIDDSAEEMSWRMLDDGFAMTLTRAVPAALEASIGAFIGEGNARGLVIHPGGAGILDAVERGVAGRAIDPRSFVASRAVLRDFGNMSSGSVLFVLEEYRRIGGTTPIELLAFGPGLTVDCVGLGDSAAPLRPRRD